MFCIDSVTRNGEIIHYIDEGASTKPDVSLIFLLHGFPDNAFGWNLQINALKDHFHVIAPFMPGTLNGDSVPCGRLECEELKKDLSLILNKVKVSEFQKVYIVAHDLGAFLAESVAKDVGQEIKGLIFLNGLGLEQFVSRKFQLTQWLKSYYAFLFQLAFVRYLVHKIMPGYFLKKAYDQSLLPLHDELRKNDNRVLSTITLYKHLFRDSFRILGKKAHRLSVPALFIWGKDDAFLNIPSLNEVDQFYNAGSVRILDGGHWVMRSLPDQVNRIIVKTLNQWEKTA